MTPHALEPIDVGRAQERGDDRPSRFPIDSAESAARDAVRIVAKVTLRRRSSNAKICLWIAGPTHD